MWDCTLVSAGLHHERSIQMAEAKKETKESLSEEIKTADNIEADTKTAKAGKRSAKAVKEAEEKQAKEEKKTEAPKDEKPKKIIKPTRSRLERRSKKYRKASEKIDSSAEYKLKEALSLACDTTTTKFDASVELHIRLNVDPKHADQNIRDSVVLPSGTGKTVKVAVFAEEDLAKEAKEAGADLAGTDEITNALDKGTIDFDVLIAPPNLMSKLAKYARVLGPKGLMPNPKSGTVTADVAKAVKQSKAGRIEYRVDTTGIVHVAIGKVSFGSEKLLVNAQAILASIKQNKPASIKGAYTKSISVSSTMGPSIKVPSSELG